MFNILLSFIIAHGFTDYFKLNNINISFTDFTFDYILVILSIELCFIYFKEITTLLFVLFSTFHFRRDLIFIHNLIINEKYNNTKNINLHINLHTNKYDQFLDIYFYIALYILSITTLHKQSKHIYILFLNKLNINDKNSSIIFKYLNIFVLLTFLKLISNYNLNIYLIVYGLFILIQYLGVINYLISYFIFIHIPIDIYSTCTNCSYNSCNIILLILSIISFIIYEFITYINIYKLKNHMYITGLSITFTHILFNLLI